MQELVIKGIQQIVKSSIKSFATGLNARYEADVLNPEGNINKKRKNIFIKELGDDFIFYSAFVRSFDSSFGNMLEGMGRSIAEYSFVVKNEIDSFILPQQEQHITYMMTQYKNHNTPHIEDYTSFVPVMPSDVRSYKRVHNTDNYFYDPKKKRHIIIELKAGGDLDNKKSESEKRELLTEYFLLKNKLYQEGKKDETVEIHFATAYNKNGEGNEWKQERVKQFFAEDELLIGCDYWNFICQDNEGFNIIMEAYRNASVYLKDAIEYIKGLY